jgi:hypothetical protein
VCYLDGAPLELAPDLGALVRSGDDVPGAGPVVFAGPFETIVPWRWDWFEETTEGEGRGLRA